MAQKSKKSTNDKGFPIDDRPIIFSLRGADDINYVGRYIESEHIFMLSINDDVSDFVSQNVVEKWCYIDEHPTIIKEVLNKKLKKSKTKKSEKDDSERESEQLPTLPPYVLDLIHSIQEKMGMVFPKVNVLMVDETNIHELPLEILNQMLEKAVSEENFELASIVRDAISKK